MNKIIEKAIDGLLKLVRAGKPVCYAPKENIIKAQDMDAPSESKASDSIKDILEAQKAISPRTPNLPDLSPKKGNRYTPSEKTWLEFFTYGILVGVMSPRPSKNPSKPAMGKRQ